LGTWAGFHPLSDAIPDHELDTGNHPLACVIEAPGYHPGPVTYPITLRVTGGRGVRTVRGISALGYSYCFT